MVSPAGITGADGPGRGLPALTAPRAPAVDLALCLPGEGPRGGLLYDQERRARLALHVRVLARLVALRPEPHPATLRAFVLARRGCGDSAQDLAGRYDVTERAVREWCEPGARAAPTAWRVVRRIREHARELAGLAEDAMEHGMPFPPESVPGLLELRVRAFEAKRREHGEHARAGPADVADLAEELWPSCRGLLAAPNRSAVLGVVRQAVMHVLALRGWPQQAIGDVVGRSRSTVAYHNGR